MRLYYRVDFRGDFLVARVLPVERFLAEVLFFAGRPIFFVDFFGAFLGTLPPAWRASDRPIAIACFLSVTL